MADEIAGANVIRVQRDGPRWCALVGPDPQRGIVAFGDAPEEALRRLAVRTAAGGWCWDETWKPH